MAIDFPTSPTVGQVFVFAAITYIWDGTKWTSSANDSPFVLGSATTPSITFIGDTNTGLYSPGADQVSVTTGGTERLRIDSAGQVEAVSLGSAAAPTYSWTGDTDTGIYSPGANQLALATNGNQRLLINGTGDIGISIASPNAKLHVGGSVWATTGELAGGNTLSTGTDGTFRLVSSGGINYLQFGQNRSTGSAAPLVFGSIFGAAEYMRIDSSGRLGVGTSAPGQLIDVQGNSNPQIKVSETNNATSAGLFIENQGQRNWQIWADRSTDTFRIGNNSRAATNLAITSTGNVGIGTTTPATRLDLSGNYAANITAVAALDIDCSTSNYFTKTINGSSTFTFSNPPASRSYSFTLELTHTSGAVTWPASVAWPSATAPTLTTGKTHLFMFVTDDGGTRWRGAALVDYTN